VGVFPSAYHLNDHIIFRYRVGAYQNRKKKSGGNIKA
jgi:hypothetical protein